MYETLNAIAANFNRSPRTIQRWINKEGLPACKLPNGNWFITDSLIDQWVIARNHQHMNSRAKHQLLPSKPLAALGPLKHSAGDSAQ